MKNQYNRIYIFVLLGLSTLILFLEYDHLSVLSAPFFILSNRQTCTMTKLFVNNIKSNYRNFHSSIVLFSPKKEDKLVRIISETVTPKITNEPSNLSNQNPLNI